MDKLVGKVLKGILQGESYRIVRRVGKGESGTVYLANQGERQVALKLSSDSTTLTLEWERLQEFSDDLNLACPVVYETDQFIYHDDNYSYYAMAYIEGLNLRQYVALKGVRVIPSCLWQVAQRLLRIHARGYAYCDLKPENLLIDTQTGELSLIDFGGVTPFGAEVNEYTEYYDRSFWGYGERKADSHYDWFALAVMGVLLLNPLKGKDKERLLQMTPSERKQFLSVIFSQNRDRFPYLRILQGMLSGGDMEDLEVANLLLKAIPVNTAVSRRFKNWNRADWGFLFSALIFSSILASMLVLGGHQTAFVIQ